MADNHNNLKIDQGYVVLNDPDAFTSGADAKERRNRIERGLKVGYELIDGAVLDIQSVISDPTTPTDKLRDIEARTGRIDDFRAMLDTVRKGITDETSEASPADLSAHDSAPLSTIAPEGQPA